MSNSKKRIEQDALGNVEVEAHRYAGAFTVRAEQHFQISDLKAHPAFKRSLALIKRAAAQVNADLGHLEKKSAKAIVQAADEFIEGQFDDEYQLDAYQAGAGTPFNMNLNEILANRANEILGGKKGDYAPVHPNNHVNMAQSSNDVTPTAIRLAALMGLEGLLFPALKELEKSLTKKSKQFESYLKAGRTHLQDAVPITLGQEFGAYASAIRHARERIEFAQKGLQTLGIGGTAIGSGINTHPQFSKKMCQELSKLTGLKLSPAPNLFETTHSMAAFEAVSASLRGLATEMLRITNDLRLLVSGPTAGLAEITLPEVEPGSSIMPGKVNPSILECMSMICIQVIGLDHAIALCNQQGQLELNWHTPLIAWDLLHQIEILSNGLNMLRSSCIDGISANKKALQKTLERGGVLATALVPYMGYAKVAELVHQSFEKGVPFVDLVPGEFKKHLVAEKMTRANRAAK